MAQERAFVDPEVTKHDRGAAEPKWMRRQRKLFTNFCNAKLCDRDDVPPVTDVFNDIKDGRLLYALLEELSGQSLAPLGKIMIKKPPKVMTRIDFVSNLSISFRYIKQTTKIVGIGPGDIADGNESLILGLLWSIIVFFTAKDLGGVDDVSALKKKILKWCQKRTEKNPDVNVRNLKDSFMGGNAFLAILSEIDPTGSPYNPSSDAKTNFKMAFHDAAQKYGVPELLDDEDEECWKDDQAMVTYLSEMMKRLPEPGLDMSILPLAHVDEKFPETVEDLKELCAIPSTPDNVPECKRAAAKVAGMMSKAGLAKVAVVPGGEDDGAPFVVGQSPKFDKMLPTILLVSDYGVDDPSQMGWATAPYEAAEEDGRVRATASASTKSGAVASVKALAAVVATLTKEQQLPVNVEILCACGKPEDYGEGGRVELFIKQKYLQNGDSPPPDYALVDAPGCLGELAPGQMGVAFACRGSASAQVAVTVGTSTSAEIGAVVGPCIDANLALCKLLASLRSSDNAPAVPGLLGLKKGSKYAAAMSNLPAMDAADVAAKAGYSGSLEEGPSLAERLCFHPNLAVTSLESTSSDGLFATESARATVLAVLAPGFKHSKGAKALAAALAEKAPWGATPKATALTGGQTGFLSEVTPIIAKLVEGSSKHSDQPAAVAGSPSYLPLPAAVARALPTTPTYAVGKDDPDSNLGLAGEAVALPNLKATIKTLVSLIVTCKQGIKKRPHGGAPVNHDHLFADVSSAASSAEP